MFLEAAAQQSSLWNDACTHYSGLNQVSARYTLQGFVQWSLPYVAVAKYNKTNAVESAGTHCVMR